MRSVPWQTQKASLFLDRFILFFLKLELLICLLLLGLILILMGLVLLLVIIGVCGGLETTVAAQRRRIIV